MTKRKPGMAHMAILPPQSVPRWKSSVTPHGATGPPPRLRDARPQNGQFFGCQKPSKTHGKTVEHRKLGYGGPEIMVKYIHLGHWKWKSTPLFMVLKLCFWCIFPRQIHPSASNDQLRPGLARTWAFAGDSAPVASSDTPDVRPDETRTG